MDREKIKNLPTSPGVYLMKDSSGKVLYIGKAKNIRGRVRQYFAGTDTRAHIPYLLQHIQKIDTVIVASEKEALLLENTLIKKHQPKYNLVLKDDKTFIAVKLTKEKWPKLDLVRLKDPPKDNAHYYGPYTSGYAAKSSIDLLNKLFPLRQCSSSEFARRTRPCILYEIGRCLAPCVNLCTKEEYNTHVEKVHLFLKGQDKEIVKKLEAEMRLYSENLEFEKAGATLRMIRQIKQTLENQTVDIPKGGNFSLFALVKEDSHLAVTLFQIKRGKLEDVLRHSFFSIAENSEEALSSFILQYYQKHPHLIPEEVLSNIPFPDKKEIEELLSELSGNKVTLSVPRRGKKYALLQTALDNAFHHLKEEKEQAISQADLLFSLQTKCHLQNFPKRIECFDISHLQGDAPVASLIVFEEGVKSPQSYRKYHLKNAKKGDDYSAMEEVLSRRFAKTDEKNPLPDLVVIDGGKGQLSVAQKVLKKLSVAAVDVIAVTKEEARHDKGLTREKVYLSEKKEPLVLPVHSPLLQLLQKIRDEAHRFAITFQRRTLQKKRIRSELEEVPGIGPKKRASLLKHFGSVDMIKKATLEELLACPNIQKKDALTLLHFWL